MKETGELRQIVGACSQTALQFPRRRQAVDSIATFYSVHFLCTKALLELVRTVELSRAPRAAHCAGPLHPAMPQGRSENVAGVVPSGVGFGDADG